MLERLYPDDPQRNQVVELHLELVNTHPAMGLLLVGLTARAERDLEAAEVVSRAVMTALTADGNRLFWSRVWPLASAVGVLLCLSRFGSLVESLALLTVYSAPQMLFLAGSPAEVGEKVLRRSSDGPGRPRN